MVTIETRQNKKGNWWCNGTINGYDVSFEEENMEMAVAKMSEYLEEHLRAGVIKWEPAEPYQESPHYLPKPYKRPFIDHNPQG